MKPVTKSIFKSLSVTTILIASLFFAQKAYAATFAFNPSNANLNQGCNYQATIMIDTQGQESNAADIIINYNINEIEIIDSNSSLPGKQIGTGNAYELYIGNEVNETLGRIRLTGSSLVQNLNGSRVFATINFKSKPAITSSAFNIVFTGSGDTLDSNIAEANTSLDMLTGVTNATFNFAAGECFTDTTAPAISFITPTSGATNVPLNSNVQIRITDGSAGVDISTVVITINGKNYTVNDSEFSYSGGPGNYLITIDPSENFPANASSSIRVEALDLKGNKAERFIHFNVPQPVPSVVPTGSPVVCPTGTVEEPEPPVVVEPGETIIIEKIVQKDCEYTVTEIKERIINTSDSVQNKNIIEKTVVNIATNTFFNKYTPLVLIALVLLGYLGIIALNIDTNLSIIHTMLFNGSKRHGLVINNKTNNPIGFAKVIINYANGSIKSMKSDIDGRFNFENGEKGIVQVIKPGFTTASIEIENQANMGPNIFVSPKSEDVKGLILSSVEMFFKALIHISPYLLGVGLALSVIQGILDQGTAITIYSALYSLIIGIKVLKKLL